tara:strand:+ start:185 stop:832 length:648 start_codon:yes stop_codon:yes gene_type:complete
MSEEEKPKKKKGLEFELGPEDSALIVRSNGHIELVSRELQDNDDESNYLGDLEDLNKTFTLVLAFAAALENEQLYQHIFHNLNNVLHRQWKKLPPEERARIKEIRLDHLLNRDDLKDNEGNTEWMNKWKDEIEKGRQNLEEYMNRGDEPFGPENRPFDDMESRQRPKRKKVNPLNKLRNTEWNPNDKTLTANRVDGPHSPFKGNWKLDSPPPEDN